MKRAPLLVIIVVFAAAGCGDSASKSGRFHYSKELRKSYMQSCVASPRVTRAYCACTLDKLSTDVSTDDFARIGRSGGIPPRIRKLITQAARDCRDKL